MSPSIVIIGGHYDTTRMATPFGGANDGGCSTAFLLELAPEVGCAKHGPSYRLVFFDGEEAIGLWSATDGLYGSRHLAAQLTEKSAGDRIKAVMVVDVIGDPQLDIQRETYPLHG